MLQPKSRTAPSAPASRPVLRRDGARVEPTFYGALDPVLVDERGEFVFPGAIRASEAMAVWTWFGRDLGPELLDYNEPADETEALAALEARAPELISRAKTVMAGAAQDKNAERRLKVQLGGGDDVWERLPAVLTALRCVPLLKKAGAFGRAVNTINDDDALGAALQSMPRQDPAIAALLMMAALGHVAVPARLIVAATRIAGGPTEADLNRAGFGPLIEAFLAHAQNTIPPLLQQGNFRDTDLACRAVDRFHKLVRGINANVELARPGRWSQVISSVTRTISNQIEPQLRDLPTTLNRALRVREGTDRLDSDSLLSALNGAYMLAAVRDSKDSLAVNEVFDDAWTRVAQALEMHVDRNLDSLRQNPTNEILRARADAGIKVAEIRFGTEYADVLRRTRESATRIR